MKISLIKPFWQSIIFPISLLLLIGIIFISASSIPEATKTLGDKLYYINKQILSTAAGVIAFVIASRINLNFIKKLALPMFIVSVILLILVLIPEFSNQILGARRWLDLKIISIQPSEIFKFTAIIFFAKLFSYETSRNIKTLFLFLVGPLCLIIIEPNFSTVVIITAIIITMYYSSGGEIISLLATCFIIVFIGMSLIISSPYRRARLNSLINFDNPKSSTSYHSNQMILGLTSGHWLGKGLANSDQKYSFIPKISTDSILAVIGEETGFVGICFIVYIYFYLVNQIVKISLQTKDSFLSLTVIGIASWIAIQSLVNMAAVVAIIPLTGVPLPLISYGGSSLLTLMSALGIVYNIQKHHTNLVYSNNRENYKDYHHHRRSSHSSH